VLQLAELKNRGKQSTASSTSSIITAGPVLLHLPPSLRHYFTRYLSSSFRQFQPKNSRIRAKTKQRLLAFFFPSITLSLSLRSSSSSLQQLNIIPIIISFNAIVIGNNGG